VRSRNNRYNGIKWLIATHLFLYACGLASAQDIHKASVEGDLDRVKQLVQEDALLIMAQDENNQTPLHMAAAQGHGEIAEFLISRGADLNAQNTYGYTAVHFAIMRGHMETAILLIQKGADVNIPTVWGSTPLHTKARAGDLAAVELLLKHGAHVHAKDVNGETPLYKAADNGHQETISFLLLNSADIDAGDANDRTPLFTAASRNDLKMIGFLLDQGAELDRTDQSGQTALHRAIIAGYVEATRALIQRGANVDATDDDAKTPLYYAGQYGHKSVAQFLRNQYAPSDQTVENFGFYRFSDRLNEREAVIWYLGHSGWAVRTKNHFLILDYYEDRPRPADPCLANGFIDPEEIRDQNVTVFVSHEHRDHYDETIFTWETSIRDIRYIFGWKALEEPKYVYMGPRIKRTVGGMDIESVHSPEAGELEGNFLVRVDGLTIYHSGDYSRGHQTFKMDMDYLASTAQDIDLFFMLAGNPMDDGEALIALQKVQPRLMFPMHAGGSEYMFRTIASTAEKEGLRTRVICAQNRGDRYVYRDGHLIKEHDN